MITYNQIISINKAFATAHFKLKAFGNGPLSEEVLHNQIATMKYPLMWMEDLTFPTRINEEVFGFRVSFVMPIPTLKDRQDDLMSTNENEAKSDMKLCAMNFLSYWAMDVNYPTLDIDKNASITMIHNATDDRLYGCYIDIQFKQAYLYDSCVIPMSGLPTPTNPCSPAFLFLNDISLDSAPSGENFLMSLVDQNSTPLAYSYNTTTNTISVTTGGGGSFTYDFLIDGVDTGQDILVDGTDINITF